MTDDAALIYVRLSRAADGDELGVDRQVEDSRRRASERGWSVVAVETDNDLSAKAGSRRPGFEAMLSAISSGQLRYVIAWNLDRLQRSRRDEVRLYEACQAHGVTISLVRGPDLEWETPTGRYLADNLGALARMEIEVKSDRQKRANLQAREQGQMHWSRRPFGYKRLASKKVVTVAREVEMLREVYGDIMAGGSLRAAVAKMNEKGHRNDSSAPWQPTVLRRILVNPRYAGLASYNGEIIGAGNWPSIFTVSEQAAMVELLSNPARLLQGGTELKHLLSGGINCGRCPQKMFSAPWKGGPRIYRCRTGHLSRRADYVDNAVEALVIARLSLPDGLALLTPAVDVVALRREAQALRARRAGLTEMLSEGLLSPEDARPRLRSLRDALLALEARISAVVGTGPAALFGDATGPDIAQRWQDMPVKDKRTVIDALLTVTILPTGKGVRWDPDRVEEQIQIDWRS